jgi:hypothetical protein
MTPGIAVLPGAPDLQAAVGTQQLCRMHTQQSTGNATYWSDVLRRAHQYIKLASSNVKGLLQAGVAWRIGITNVHIHTYSSQVQARSVDTTTTRWMKCKHLCFKGQTVVPGAEPFFVDISRFHVGAAFATACALVGACEWYTTYWYIRQAP